MVRQEEQIAKAIEEKIKIDNEALALLNGKLIAEVARAEGAQRVLREHEKAVLLLKQAEENECELLLLETQAKEVATAKLETIVELKIVAQQRVEAELMAARGIEIQLKAEKDATAAAVAQAEIAEYARQAAKTREAQDKQYSLKEEEQLKADQSAVQGFDHKLELINERIKIARQQAQLILDGCLVEEKKLQLENAVLLAERERVSIEQRATDALEKRLALQMELTQTATLRLQTENRAISEISLRMETELKAIEADNARIILEVAAREIIEAQLIVTEKIVSAAKMKEENEVRGLRMAKLRAEAEARAAQAESDAFQAHTYANQLALQRLEVAENLQIFIDERVKDEKFYLELGLKKCDAEKREGNLAKVRLEAEKNYLNEVEMRISAESQAVLVTNQRQIAEQLLRLAALDKWSLEKQTVLGLKPAGVEFCINVIH